MAWTSQAFSTLATTRFRGLSKQFERQRGREQGAQNAAESRSAQRAGDRRLAALSDAPTQRPAFSGETSRQSGRWLPAGAGCFGKHHFRPSAAQGFQARGGRAKRRWQRIGQKSLSSSASLACPARFCLEPRRAARRRERRLWSFWRRPALPSSRSLPCQRSNDR